MRISTTGLIATVIVLVVILGAAVWYGLDQNKSIKQEKETIKLLENKIQVEYQVIDSLNQVLLTTYSEISKREKTIDSLKDNREVIYRAITKTKTEYEKTRLNSDTTLFDSDIRFLAEYDTTGLF